MYRSARIILLTRTAIILISVTNCLAQNDWYEATKLLPKPYLGNNYENFGCAIDANEKYIVIGSKFYENGKGRVLILSNDFSYDTLAILQASDLTTESNFGYSVSISDSVVAIGAPGAENYPGAVYIFAKPANGWMDMTETAKLVTKNRKNNDSFGFAVSIYGNIVVVGAYKDSSSLGAAYVFEKPNSGWENMTETSKLYASEVDMYDFFGIAVDIYENTIVIGASQSGIYSSGQAYIFEKSDTAWNKIARLSTSNDSISMQFGRSIEIHENTIVVGVPGDQENGIYSGAVYLFEKTNSIWSDMTETAKLIASDAQAWENFGIDVDLSDSSVIAGVPYNNQFKGCTYVFDRPSDGWENMTETAKITALDGNKSDFFGFSVKILDSLAIIGAPYDDGNGKSSGSMYLFKKDNNGQYSQNETAKISAFDPFPTNADDNFGIQIFQNEKYIVIGSNTKDNGILYLFSSDSPYDTLAIFTISEKFNFQQYGTKISVDENTIVVGSYEDGHLWGAAYVFVKPETGWISMSETAKLTISDENKWACRVNSVLVKDDIIALGCPGYSSSGGVFLYLRPESGWDDMNETAILTPSDAYAQQFGYSICMDMNTIVIGATHDNEIENGSGAVYIFEKPFFGWTNMTETVKLKASDAGENDEFGYSIGFSNNTILVGARYKNIDFPFQGAAYIFEKPSNGWIDANESAKILASDGDRSDYFGASVNINNNIIVIGAPHAKGVTTDGSGAAYVYVKPENGWVDTTESAKITAFDEEMNSEFGNKVSIKDSSIIVSAYYKEGSGVNSGAVYVYEHIQSAKAEILTKCKKYLSPSGKYEWNESGSYIDTLIGSYGQDSLIFIDLTINSVDMTINLNENVLSANAVDATYKWLNCENKTEIPGEVNQSFTPEESGDYAVIIEQNGCVDTSSCYSVVLSDVKFNKLENRMKVYPNPTSEEFNIQFDKTYNKIKIEIETLTGQLIQKQEFSGTNKANINISGSPGVYFISVSTDTGEKATAKIIKE